MYLILYKEEPNPNVFYVGNAPSSDYFSSSFTDSIEIVHRHFQKFESVRVFKLADLQEITSVEVTYKEELRKASEETVEKARSVPKRAR